MRKWMAMAAAAAALLWTQAATAEDTSKDMRQGAAETREEMKEGAQEARDDMKQGADRTADRARDAASDTRAETRERMERQDRTAAMGGEKEHPLFGGKDNFEVKGKLQKVAGNKITVTREELPAATLNVTKQTKIELDGEKATLKQLKPGADVQASFNLKGDKPEAVEIKAEKTEAQK